MKTTKHDIYRNLNKARKEPSRHVWSMRTKGRVVGHSEDVIILDAEFKVSESTRQRIIKANKRNVCAFVRGTLFSETAYCELTYPNAYADWPTRRGGPLCTLSNRVRVSFNPYKSGSFYVCETGQPVTHADAVVFTVNGAFAINPR